MPMLCAGVVKAANKPSLHRINAHGEDHRNGRGGRLCRHCGGSTASSYDCSHCSIDQLCRQHRQPGVLAIRPPILDRYILALHKTRLLKPSAKCGEAKRVQIRRCTTEKADDGDRLLRVGGHRPRSRDSNAYDELPRRMYPPQGPRFWAWELSTFSRDCVVIERALSLQATKTNESSCHHERRILLHSRDCMAPPSHVSTPRTTPMEGEN